ncbi:cold-shock protein [Novosphingobium sp. ZW T3_23]|uniref:cold-shock protein n=1 Tax=Novosphingobium sp. ZW T3_23 TaxID=3378084 RepID=UPI003852D175
MPLGKVVFFNARKGYGFIAAENGGADCFVHIAAVISSGIWNLEAGQAIGYDLLVARNGKVSAVNLFRSARS